MAIGRWGLSPLAIDLYGPNLKNSEDSAKRPQIQAFECHCAICQTRNMDTVLILHFLGHTSLEVVAQWSSDGSRSNS